ncbi:late embryogenesis abundant protein Lea5 [Lathyrus oleraceus]|uniref:late embryogenesis abundant protein Lea5 n=1 Tax=Pisum sativum TaxID=3888 RepID=UPI001FC439C7|nr:late embryogenesis abundant protein Lea5 [Pisum sativum]
MARSLSQAKHLVSQSLPLFHLHRRGFAAVSDVSARVGRGKLGSLEETPVSKDGQEACSAWVPDPETGYYRPVNCAPEIDPVELRQVLLKHNTRSSN